MSKKNKSVILVLATLASIGVWIDITGYLNVFVNPASTNDGQEIAHYACYAGRIAMACLFLATPSAFDRPAKQAIPLVLGIMVVGTVLQSFGLNQSLFNPIAVAALGSALIGIGHIWVVSAAYAFIMQSYSRKDTLLILVAAQVSERLLAESASLAFTEPVLLLASYLLPLISACLFGMAIRLIGRHRFSKLPDSEEVTGSARQYLIALCSMVGVGLVACGATSTAGIWGNASSGQYAGDGSSFLLAIAECALVMLLCRFTFIADSGKSLALRYQSSLLVIITGFAFSLSQEMLSLLPEAAIDIFLVSVENYTHILFWVIAIDAASSISWPFYRTFGIGIFACSSTGFFWSILLENGFERAEPLIFILFYLLVTGCIIYPQAINRNAIESSADEQALNALILDGEKRLNPGINGKALQTALEQRCSYITQQYSLSPREGDVLVLLVKGMTRQAMCTELCLSEGTVKTHLAHIYTKLDIHSQAELIEIAYSANTKNEKPDKRKIE